MVEKIIETKKSLNEAKQYTVSYSKDGNPNFVTVVTANNEDEAKQKVLESMQTRYPNQKINVYGVRESGNEITEDVDDDDEVEDTSEQDEIIAELQSKKTFEEFYDYLQEIDCVPEALENDIVPNDWDSIFKPEIEDSLDGSDLSSFIAYMKNHFMQVYDTDAPYFKVDGYANYKNFTDDDIDLYIDDAIELIKEMY
jgi:hypothetical protein